MLKKAILVVIILIIILVIILVIINRWTGKIYRRAGIARRSGTFGGRK